MSRDARDHYVYTAYDATGRVLYVGCTKRLGERQSDHRFGSDWYASAVRFRLQGPYTYATGRQVEREQLALLRPLYAFHPARRTLSAIYHRISRREHDRLQSEGLGWTEALHEASALATELTGYTTNRAPMDITDEVLRQAFESERRYESGRAA